MANWNNFPNPFPPPFPSTVNGLGYSVQMPPGFNAMPTDPWTGGNFAWPAGSTPPPASPALVWMMPIPPLQLQGLMQHYYNFDNPWVATFNAQSLGLLSVLRIAPLRQTTLNGASALIREFDAISSFQQPVRMSAMLLQGPSSALQCIVGINMYRWVEFIGATMQFVANIQLTGTFAPAGEIRSVIDRQNLNRVEVQLVNADHTIAPIMSLPTQVQGAQVYQIRVEAGGVIRFGDVKGTNVQFGDHNTAGPH